MLNSFEATPALEKLPKAPLTALERLRPRLLALTPAQLLPLRPDLRPMLAAAQALAQEVAEPALRARLSRLPREELDPVHAEQLGLAADGVAEARVQLDAALATPQEAQLPAELVEKAGALKERMLRVARYHLEDDEAVGKTLASLQRKRTGHGEMAADLRRLGQLYREQKSALAADTRHYRESDAAEAEQVAREIGAQLSAVGGEAIRAATEELSRAQALLVQSHEEVRAALLFLLRHDATAPERFPALLALPPGRGRPRKSTPPAPPSELS